MNLPTLQRRTLVTSGAIYAGALALAGTSARVQPTSVQVNPAAVNGPLLGWFVISPDGGSRLTIFQVDARSAPVRQIMAVAGGSATSVAGAVREANDAVLQTVASLWNVPTSYCTLVHGGIRLENSGQIVPFSIWTDFA